MNLKGGDIYEFISSIFRFFWSCDLVTCSLDSFKGAVSKVTKLLGHGDTSPFFTLFFSFMGLTLSRYPF